MRDGALHLTHTGGLAVLGLGDAAATKWAERIRSPRSSIADTVIFAAAKDAGLTCTKVVRFSDTDSAETLVIPVAAR